MHHLHYRPIAFGYNNKTFIIKPLNLKLMFIYTLKYGRAVFYAIQRAWSVTFELFLYFFFYRYHFQLRHLTRQREISVCFVPFIILTRRGKHHHIWRINSIWAVPRSSVTTSDKYTLGKIINSCITVHNGIECFIQLCHCRRIQLMCCKCLISEAHMKHMWWGLKILELIDLYNPFSWISIFFNICSFL